MIKESNHAVRRGNAEEPLVVAGGLIGDFRASGKELAFIRRERGVDLIGCGDDRFGEFGAVK